MCWIAQDSFQRSIPKNILLFKKLINQLADVFFRPAMSFFNTTIIFSLFNHRSGQLTWILHFLFDLKKGCFGPLFFRFFPKYFLIFLRAKDSVANLSLFIFNMTLNFFNLIDTFCLLHYAFNFFELRFHWYLIFNRLYLHSLAYPHNNFFRCFIVV